MIESLEIDGWDGIHRGSLPRLAARTLLVCPDARCRSALFTALGFLRIEEQDAGSYTDEWSQREPWVELPSALVPDGRATLRAQMDGRQAVLQVEVDGLGLRGWAEDPASPHFQLAIDPRDGMVTGIRGLSEGPRTMRRCCMVANMKARLPSSEELSFLVSRSTEQILFLVPHADPDAARHLGWETLAVSIDGGLLHVES